MINYVFTNLKDDFSISRTFLVPITTLPVMVNNWNEYEVGRLRKAGSNNKVLQSDSHKQDEILPSSDSRLESNRRSDDKFV